MTRNPRALADLDLSQKLTPKQESDRLSARLGYIEGGAHAA